LDSNLEDKTFFRKLKKVHLFTNWCTSKLS